MDTRENCLKQERAAMVFTQNMDKSLSEAMRLFPNNISVIHDEVIVSYEGLSNTQRKDLATALSKRT